MSNPSAKVIADSISPDGIRLTTMEVHFHRWELASLNTHRAFSRNSASSRAIPIAKEIEKVLTDPALPLEFGTKKKGMQAGPPLEGEGLGEAVEVWLEAAQDAVRAAQKLDAMGVHKQVANRLLEPFLWHTAIITSTEWDNFFQQRVSPQAQREIAVPAQLMECALEASEPKRVAYEQWHLPYLTEDDRYLTIEEKRKVSAARCARVSYLTHDGKRSVEKDLELYDRLISADPPHWSPLEHVATPAGPENFYGTEGNFEGWCQLRHERFYQ